MSVGLVFSLQLGPGITKSLATPLLGISNSFELKGAYEIIIIVELRSTLNKLAAFSNILSVTTLNRLSALVL